MEKGEQIRRQWGVMTDCDEQVSPPQRYNGEGRKAGYRIREFSDFEKDEVN
jgi:hypothetical protein